MRGRKLEEPWEVEEETKQTRSRLDDLIDKELLENRIVVINGELKEELVDKICRRLLYLGIKDKKPVTVILNSVGGEVYLGL